MSKEYLRDSSFLCELDKFNNKFIYVKIIVLDMEEHPISSIEGRIEDGASINIDGSSAMRRTCSLNFVALEEENDLTNIENLLSINKKIKIEVGIENNFPNNYNDEIFWFPQGIFVITEPEISNSSSGCTISLSCKDKMALLNGDCGGNLPSSVTFHEYDQILGLQKVDNIPSEPNNYTIYFFENSITLKGETSQFWRWSKTQGFFASSAAEINTTVSMPNPIYDIIQTLVCNYGGESIDKIIINDIPLEIKQLVRNCSSGSIFYNPGTGEYSMNQSLGIDNSGSWLEFKPGEDCGYVYTDFTYPGELVSGIGDNICSVLDKIKNTLGNYEYFYDIDGNFVFQEIRNYLNVSYSPPALGRMIIPLNYDSDIFENHLTDITKLPTNEDRINLILNVVNTRGIFLGKEDINFNISYPSVNGNIEKVIITYVNSDAAWEKVNNTFIINEDNYLVDYNSNKKSIYVFNENDNLITNFSNSPSYTNIKNDFHIWGKNGSGNPIHYHLAIKEKPSVMNTYYIILDNKQVKVVGKDKGGFPYTPDDWRIELFLSGKEKESRGMRPDIYEQEIIDYLPTMFSFKQNNDGSITGEYLEDITKVNNLNYFIDYLEPTNSLYDYSIDLIGSRIYSYQQDSIIRMFNNDVPNVIIINKDGDQIYNNEIIKKCVNEGQTYTNVDGIIYSNFGIGTLGYTAQEVARDLLYQYTDYNSAISFSCVPIFYLEPNTRITVRDKKSNIYGDYIIKSISRPLNGQGTMNVSAVRALEKI